jgi:oligopeptide transport system permease protein
MKQQQQQGFRWDRFRANYLAVFGSVLLAIMLVLAVFGGFFIPDQSPNANTINLSITTQKPIFRAQFITLLLNEQSVELPVYSYSKFGQDSCRIEVFTGNTTNEGRIYTCSEQQVQKALSEKVYWLGTDRLGRDFLSRLVLGTRISLAVGCIAVFIALCIGLVVGSLSGYYGGKVDALLSWFTNIVWAVPTLILVLAITFALGKGFWQVFIGVGLTMWVEIARLVRGQVMALKQQEFIEACKSLGYSDARIIFRHILPNLMGPIIVISASNFSSAILIEAGLSFLGMGVQPPVPTWGNMIKEHYSFIVLDAAYLALIPGIAIMLLVMALVFIGDGLRDTFDVKKI